MIINDENRGLSSSSSTRIKYLPMVAAFTAVLSSAAQAIPVELNNITATWFDANPAANASFMDNGTTSPKVRWGDNSDNNSGYDFLVAAQPITFDVPPSPSPNQVIGTFTHQNYPISSGTSITDIKLEIKADVTIDGAFQSTQTFDYAFEHWETPNGANPCANGGANHGGVNLHGCADRVIANWLSTSDDFVIGTDTFTLNVIGFSLNADGTNPFTSFWTAEKQTNDAYLVANVALRSDMEPDPGPTPTPVPATLALFGIGGLMLSWKMKRKSRA